jgi:hypothetical protein
MTTATEQPTVKTIDPPGNAGEGTCDKVRDPFMGDHEFAGRAVWTCNKTAGHDNRGAHRMVDAQGRTTQWRGADND